MKASVEPEASAIEYVRFEAPSGSVACTLKKGSRAALLVCRATAGELHETFTTCAAVGLTNSGARSFAFSTSVHTINNEHVEHLSFTFFTLLYFTLLTVFYSIFAFLYLFYLMGQ